MENVMHKIITESSGKQAALKASAQSAHGNKSNIFSE